MIGNQNEPQMLLKQSLTQRNIDNDNKGQKQGMKSTYIKKISSLMKIPNDDLVSAENDDDPPSDEK